MKLSKPDTRSDMSCDLIHVMCAMSKLISQKLRVERESGEGGWRNAAACLGGWGRGQSLHTLLISTHIQSPCVYVSGKNKYNAGAGKMTQLVKTCLAT